MGDTAAGLAAAALFVVAGFALTSHVARLRRLALPARFGWAYLAGLVWVCGASFMLSQLGLAPLRRGTFSAVAAAAVLPSLISALRRRPWPARRRAAGEHRPEPLRHRLLAWSCAFFLAAAIAGVLARATREPLADWDGRMTWAPAARWICAEGTVRPRVLAEPRWTVSHPTYPLLLPIADCVALQFAGRREGAEPYRVLYGLQLAALLAVTWTGASRWAGRRAAWLATAAIALAPFPAWNPDGGATGAYSDLGLAALFGGGLVLLVRPRQRSEAVIGGLLLAGAVLTKNEGMWLAVVGCAACGLRAFTTMGKGRARTSWLVAATAVAVTALAVHAWAAAIPWRGDESYRVLSQRQHLSGAVAALGGAAPAAIRQMIDATKWSLLWWIAPALALLGWRGWLRTRFAPLWLAAALPLAVGAAAYALHPRAADLAAVTWSRFVVQSLVPTGVILALALRRALRAESS